MDRDDTEAVILTVMATPLVLLLMVVAYVGVMLLWTSVTLIVDAGSQLPEPDFDYYQRE